MTQETRAAFEKYIWSLTDCETTEELFKGLKQMLAYVETLGLDNPVAREMIEAYRP